MKTKKRQKRHVVYGLEPNEQYVAWIFGRPFVKQFTLCYRTVVLSVCDVGVWRPNGWTDQDETWHGCRPRPRSHCVKWGPAPLPKGAQPLPHFGPCMLWPNGCMDQDATWYGGRPRSKPHCVRNPALLPQKGTKPPNFRPLSIVSKQLDGRSPI